MEATTLWKLHRLLQKNEIILDIRPVVSSKQKQKHKNGACNGLITYLYCLISCAIQYFTNGCPSDIVVVNGISV